MENNPYMGSPEANIYSKNCVVCNRNFIGKGKGRGICFGCALEKDIKTVEEKIKSLDNHIANYERNDCKTAVYQELVKERNAISNVVNELKRIRNFDIDNLIEDYETRQFVHKDNILKIIKELNIDIERNKRREINNNTEGNLQMTLISYDPELVKMRLVKLLEEE